MLQYFYMYDELEKYWSWLKEFVSSPRVAFAVKNRLIAEQVYTQIGARPEYVPMVMLHTRGIVYNPHRIWSEVLVFRCSHPAFHPFRYALSKALKDTAGADAHVLRRVVFHVDATAARGRPLSYEEMATYRAIVLTPHVPNACSFHDVYAMKIPMFLPAEPYIYKWMWRFSGPYAGPGGDKRMQSRILKEEQKPQAPLAWLSARGAEAHPYDVFRHLMGQHYDNIHDEPYCYQYSDYAILPHLQRFRSASELVLLLSGFSDKDGRDVSHRMSVVHERRVSEVSRWMACTFATLANGLVGRPPPLGKK